MRQQTFPPQDPAFTVEHVSKTYGRRRVLDDVTMTVNRGEIHALLGQNGSGKSTLIKILAGQIPPDPRSADRTTPSLTIAGVRNALPISPSTSGDLGMVFVHQDLGLVPSASVTESLGLGRYRATRWGRLRWKEQEALTRDALRQYDIDASPGTLVRELTDVDRAILAIVRGVSFLRGEGSAAKTLFLDEPTAFLPADAASRFFDVLRDLAREGHGVVFVSHRLDEVLEVCDRASVLRDGRLVETRELAGVDRAELVQAILGHALEPHRPRRPAETRQTVLSVRHLSGRRVRDVSFDGEAGEVIGITGLLGSGFEETAYLAFGAVKGSGSISLGGQEYPQRSLSPRRAIGLGMGLLPADRRGLSGVGSATAAENLSLAQISQKGSLSPVRARGEIAGSEQQMQHVGVRPPLPALPLASFSGGNQQKVLFMKWLSLKPRLLWLHEPTHGVDVGAKSSLHGFIARTAEAGCCIVIASTEYEDIAEICDRVMVFHRGRLTSELAGAELTYPNLLHACMADPGRG